MNRQLKKDQKHKRTREIEVIKKDDKKLKLTKKHSNDTSLSSNQSIATSKSSKSSSDSACSVLSLNGDIESEPIPVDFDCRTIENNQFCLRKNKIVTYRSLFKKTTKSKTQFDIRKDDLVAKQYKIIKLMGKGTFSQVYLCKDISTNREIALKIFTQRNQASLVKIEQTIANHLKKLDPTDVFNFVKMLDTFRCVNQFFIVYETLGPSLFDFMDKIRKSNYTVQEIREISRQICITLEFLHEHKIIHTDIKPENILFINKLDNKNQLIDTRIKLIDFGSSIINSDDRNNHGTVTTRHYRAPEVVMKLNQGWSYPIDVWSVAITLFEMRTRELIFPSVISNYQHFVIMSFTLGKLPNMYRKQKPSYFKRLEEIDEIEIKKHKPLEKHFKIIDSETLMLIKFIRRMVIYEPDKRATMKQLIDDPFLKI